MKSHTIKSKPSNDTDCVVPNIAFNSTSHPIPFWVCLFYPVSQTVEYSSVYYTGYNMGFRMERDRTWYRCLVLLLSKESCNLFTSSPVLLIPSKALQSTKLTLFQEIPKKPSFPLQWRCPLSPSKTRLLWQKYVHCYHLFSTSLPIYSWFSSAHHAAFPPRI